MWEQRREVHALVGAVVAVELVLGLEVVQPRADVGAVQLGEAGGRDVLVAISAAAGGAPFTVLERDVRAAWAEMERRVQGSAVPS